MFQHALGAVSVAALFAATASAQFGNEWASFQNQTAGRLVSAASVGVSDTDEKDYAWADLDQDGWVDLVSVRKQPATTTGKRINALFMNENGVLTDRADIYTSSDVPGDQGFLTATNDRDVVIADIDLDGWLDVITASARTSGDPKHISHPRAYRNQQDSGGVWQGLMNEDARIPQLVTPSGTSTMANACGITAGDVDDDGSPDLFLVDYDSLGGSGTNDMGHKLLINDGSGFFDDESSLRMTSSMLSSAFGNSAYIVELNGEPGLDIIRGHDGDGDVFYNDDTSVGFFNLEQDAQDGSPYHVGVGDLNNDGRIDAVWSDDGSDRIRYNTGTDALGRVIWGTNKTFNFLTGGDDGFGSNSLITDIDGDNWNDVIIADFDVDVSGCSRRIHIYHNEGGTPGTEVNLVEEAGGPSFSDWKGVKGIVQSDLTGGHDVAVFDIDNDGDNDMVLGRCSGTSVWMNDTSLPVCQKDLGFGGPGTAEIEICGGDLSPATSATFTLRDGPLNSLGVLGIGPVNNPVFLPFLGGTIVPFPATVLINIATGPAGTTSATVQGGSAPSTWFFQAVVLDPFEPLGFAVSNALEVEFLP